MMNLYSLIRGYYRRTVRRRTNTGHSNISTRLVVIRRREAFVASHQDLFATGATINAQEAEDRFKDQANVGTFISGAVLDLKRLLCSGANTKSANERITVMNAARQPPQKPPSMLANSAFLPMIRHSQQPPAKHKPHPPGDAQQSQRPVDQPFRCGVIETNCCCCSCC